jgi:hypothetical protein
MGAGGGQQVRDFELQHVVNKAIIHKVGNTTQLLISVTAWPGSLQ